MRKQWIAVALTAAVAATTGGAMPAAASQHRHRPPSLTIVHGMHRLSSHNAGAHIAQMITDGAAATSAHWSGYVDAAARSLHFKSISSSFTVPSVNCANSPDGSFAAFWAGLDGWADSTVEHVGVLGSCSGGSASYLAFYQMSPLLPVAFSGVSPGDAVSASVVYNAPTWTLTLTDITTGGSVNTTQSCPTGSTCRNRSAEVIAEAPTDATGGGLPLADFGQANFVNASVTGLSGAKGTLATKTGHWTSKAVTMVSGADTLAVPSTLEGGKAFYVTWQASQ
jgi:Peptidase A4 family